MPSWTTSSSSTWSVSIQKSTKQIIYSNWLYFIMICFVDFNCNVNQTPKPYKSIGEICHIIWGSLQKFFASKRALVLDAKKWSSCIKLKKNESRIPAVVGTSSIKATKKFLDAPCIQLHLCLFFLGVTAKQFPKLAHLQAIGSWAMGTIDDIRIRCSFLQRTTSETRISLKAPHSRVIPAVAPPGHYWENPKDSESTRCQWDISDILDSN